MSKQISFTGLENKFLPEMRRKINNSEDRVDLQNHFSYVMSNFLNSVFEENELFINQEDIYLNTDVKNYYSLSPQLKNSAVFQDIWSTSDIPDVLKRFASTAYNKYIRFSKHQEKTNKKLRN